MRGIEPLLVQTMADFVNQREKGVREIVDVVANGDTAIARSDMGAEGMDAGIDAATLEVEPQGDGRLDGKGVLTFERVVALENGMLAAAARCGDGHQERRQLI